MTAPIYIPPGAAKGLASAANYALGRAYSAITPDVFENGDYTPEQWRDWNHAIRSHDSVGRPTTQEGLEYMRFRDTALPRLEQRFAEWQAMLPKEMNSSDALAALKPLVFADLLGDRTGMQSSDERTRARAVAVRDNFMDFMKDRSFGGERMGDTSVTPETLAEWKADPNKFRAWNADYRLSENGKKVLRNTLDYNLFSTFQTGEHKPIVHQVPLINSAASVVAGLFDGAMTASPGPALRDTQGARRMRTLFTPSPLNAMRYSMGLWDQAQEMDPDFWRTDQKGSPVPQFSMTTGHGMQEVLEGGATPYGRATNAMTNFVFDLGDPQQAEARQVVADVHNTQERPTPVRYPDASADAAADAIREWRDGNWQKATVYMPELTEKLGLGRRYPSRFVNEAFNVIPGILGDPGNIAGTLLSGGIGAALGGGLKAFGTAAAANIADAPNELGFNTAVSLSQTPQTPYQYLFESDPNNPLRTADDRIPDPSNLKEYNAAVMRWEDGRQNMLQTGRSFLNNQKRLAAEAKKSAGRPRMKMLTELRDATAPALPAAQTPDFPQMSEQYSPFSEDSPGLQMQREIERRNAAGRAFPK